MVKKPRTFTVSKDIKEKLKTLADKQDKSISSTLNILIKKYIEEHGCQ